MKIEKINDNQIRCTLSGSDLTDRQLSLKELAYGSPKARSLFHEMIQLAHKQVGFEVEDIPLMIEAVPLSKDSIMLVITKVENPEELDSRFSRFSPDVEQLNEVEAAGKPAASLAGTQEMLEMLSGLLSGAESEEKEPASAPQSAIFRFAGIRELLKLRAFPLCGTICAGSLYHDENEDMYYLVLESAGAPPQEFHLLCNMMTEYATPVAASAALMTGYYKEHYRCLFPKKALQQLIGG